MNQNRPASDPEPLHSTADAVAEPPWRWETAVRCHPGRLREVNEDAYLARPDLGLWAVADGMGGHAAGDFASRTVIALLDRITAPPQGDELIQRVEASVLEAHIRIRNESARRGHQTIGSTVAVLAAVGQRRCVVLWAGDSRVYLYRRGTLQRMSRDHSVAEERVEQGSLDPDHADDSPDANVLTRAIGMEGELVLQRVEARPLDQDIFMLCSDGLNKELSDEELGAILATPVPLERKADALLERSLEHGGRDNITFVLVHPVQDMAP